MGEDLIEVCIWMKGFNKDDVCKVLVMREPGRTRGNGFKFHRYSDLTKT